MLSLLSVFIMESVLIFSGSVDVLIWFLSFFFPIDMKYYIEFWTLNQLLHSWNKFLGHVSSFLYIAGFGLILFYWDFLRLYNFLKLYWSIVFLQCLCLVCYQDDNSCRISWETVSFLFFGGVEFVKKFLLIKNLEKNSPLKPSVSKFFFVGSFKVINSSFFNL